MPAEETTVHLWAPLWAWIAFLKYVCLRGEQVLLADVTHH